MDFVDLFKEPEVERNQTVSFLLGSGFSIGVGLPGVAKLNQRLRKIDASELYIGSDMNAFFLNGQNDPNPYQSRGERLFIQEFLDFYNSEVLKNTDPFNYEDFYDFYALYLYQNENKELIESFCLRFNEKHYNNNGKYSIDPHNRINMFDRTFNQLIANELFSREFINDVSYLNYRNYEDFIHFISELSKTTFVRVHTLNHDLFFDFLGHQHSKLFQHFSDGYQLEGSPFYGIASFELNRGTDYELRKSFHIKLEHFTNKFNTPITLFKLHGSIYNVILYTQDNKVVRVKDNYGVSQFLQEVNDDRTGSLTFMGAHDDISPDFLSGRINKSRYYINDPYYKVLFDHFRNNLAVSDKLFVIGYGFMDPGINKYLEDHYLSSGKEVIVIDPSPILPNEQFLGKYKVNHIKRGVTEVPFDMWNALMYNTEETNPGL